MPSARALIVACLMLGSMTLSSAKAQTQTEQPAATCDLRVLGRLTVLDTAQLTRRSWNGPMPGTSEGVSLTTYTDQSRPRLLVATYLGETGKLTSKFYVKDNRTFVVDREEVEYSQPITTRARPRVASRVRQLTYVCEGKVVQDSSRASAANALRELENLLQLSRDARADSKSRP